MNLNGGAVDYGSRTPLEATPAWATLEVLTGGFATGRLLAGGVLLEHELVLLRQTGALRKKQDRQAINTYFLSEHGLADLNDRLRSGHYEVTVPEEGALLVVAWLAGSGHVDQARALVKEIAPHFNQMRFYPVPSEQPASSCSTVCVQVAPAAVRQLLAVRPNQKVLVQKEAVEIWAPFMDKMVALFLETVDADWPCQTYPFTWRSRGRRLLSHFAELRKAHLLCGNPDNTGKHFYQLRIALERAVSAPRSLNGRDVARIRGILKKHIDRRGAPDSEKLTSYRKAQGLESSAPLHHHFAKVVAVRATCHGKGMSAEEIAFAVRPITTQEAVQYGVPEGERVPKSIARKIQRCLTGSLIELASEGVITSSETLAEALPQLTAAIRAQTIDDAPLRQLYVRIYSAFRLRRSLLLLNMQRQVQLEELPWIAAIDKYRAEDSTEQDVARKALTDIAVTAFSAFPQTILPNKLIRELKALVTGCGMGVPFVEELAADIYRGKFSPTFVDATLRTAEVMRGTLYATYYGIDYESIARKLGSARTLNEQQRAVAAENLALLCSERAGVPRYSKPAANGMVIEQQQILTTHNLAVLFSTLELHKALDTQLFSMAQDCFRWVCRRQQLRINDYHTRLIMLKNTAYAWRQMIFFLSFQPNQVPDFLKWASHHFSGQSEGFKGRFEAAMAGLAMASVGRVPAAGSEGASDARRFLGWSSGRHWLYASEGS